VKQPNWNTKRKKPYTETGVRRFYCIRCREKQATQQWQICSDGNNYRPICNLCDVELNTEILHFMKDPHRVTKICKYRLKIFK